MSKFVTRPATVGDAVSVVRVHNHARAAYYGPLLDAEDASRNRLPMWLRMLGEPHRQTVVALDPADHVIGFVSSTPSDHLQTRELTGLYVDPAYWGTGVADTLYASFLAELGEQVATLEVWTGNSRAMAFYKRRDWIPTEQQRSGPGDYPFAVWQLPPRGVRAPGG